MKLAAFTTAIHKTQIEETNPTIFEPGHEEFDRRPEIDVQG